MANILGMGVSSRVAVEGMAGDGPRTGSVVAVTAARPGTAKRGLAVAVARVLARTTPRVCVIDADGSTRDVTQRFDLDGKSLHDIAVDTHEDVLTGVARDEESGCWVVPATGHHSSDDVTLALD